MVNPEARRQKLLARKRQKRKAKTPKTITVEARLLDKYLALVAHAPIHECLVPTNLFELGIGNLVCSRSLADGHVALAIFLLDVFCLGIKQAPYTIIPGDEYLRRLRRLSEPMQPVHPACLRKLVEGAIAYASNLGFKPHADYAVASEIFGDIDPALCAEHFEYGHEGMPQYISGPNETLPQARAIVEHLSERLGPGKFHYVIQLR